MSVVILCFANAPKVSEEAVRKDAELDKYLESRVEGENGLVQEKNLCLITKKLESCINKIQLFLSGPCLPTTDLPSLPEPM